jgi:hypothetical protein
VKKLLGIKVGGNNDRERRQKRRLGRLLNVDSLQRRTAQEIPDLKFSHSKGLTKRDKICHP